jgi:hypothetical protein
MLKEIGHMHSHKRFRRMKHRLILSSLAILVAAALPGLAEARGGHSGGGFRHGGWHHGGGAASRFKETGTWLGASSAGTNHRFDAEGHEGNGWYHRGWGGTTAPGWGYGRGPNSRIGSWKGLRTTIGNASLSAPAPDAPISVFLLGRRSGGP